ncbi:MAG: sigma-70 family RNA polymerase sigma factor [Planctomycetes bacterium]|nr:sigma-70 family RNA polymerase sigma factor [Planctomycetota bacterium]
MSEVERQQDGELLERARLGDAAALSTLIRRHADRLLRSIQAELGERLRRRLSSEDVVQEVYVDVLGSIRAFEDRGDDAFFRWLRAIALNRIRDADRREFKTQKRGPEVRGADLDDASMSDFFDRLAGSMTTPSGRAEQHDRARRLREALEQIGTDQREAIQLRYLRHLDVAETAARMDRTERAVRNLCVRALIRLREILGDDV